MKRLVVLLFLLVTACGGGSDGDDPKAAYLKSAEALCASANDRLDQAKKEQPTDVTTVPPYVRRLLAIAKQTLREISALTPPAGDAGEVQSKLVEPLQTQVADGEAFAAKVDAAAAAKDTQQLTSLIFNPPTQTRVDLAWMKSYGFKDCLKAADTGAATK